MSRNILSIVLLISGPLLICIEKITYGEAAALKVNHIVDWLFQHRPYHLLFCIFSLAGLAILLVEMMNRIDK